MKLPDACVCHILSFLDDDVLQVTKRVSKRLLALSNSMRRVVDLRETRRDVFTRNLIVGKTGGITIGLRRFPPATGAPAGHAPITGFPARYVCSVFMAGACDDIYKCDLTYMTRLEVEPLYYRILTIPRLEGILQTCTQLRTLAIPRVIIPPGGVHALATMSKLARLNISDARFAPGTHVVFPLSLTNLNASYCTLDSHNIGDLTKLKHLNATDIGLDRDSLGKVMKLTNLESLDISWNDSWDDIGGAPHDISRLGRLRSLSACMMPNLRGYYRVAALGTLRNLASLELENCNLWNADVEWMAAGTNVKRLNLSYNYIDAAGTAHICRATQFTAIDLSYNNVDDEGARVIAGQTRLERLELQHNLVTSEGAHELAGMPLRTLGLARNLISETEADAILESSTIPDLYLGRQRKN